MTVPCVFKNAKLWFRLYETAKPCPGDELNRSFYHEFTVDGLRYRLNIDRYYSTSWSRIILYTTLGGETMEPLYWNFAFDGRNKAMRTYGKRGSQASSYNNTKFSRARLPHEKDPAVRAELEHIILILALTLEGETV